MKLADSIFGTYACDSISSQKHSNVRLAATGKLVIHLVKGKEPEAGYPRTDWGASNGGDGDKILRECLPTLEAAGISTANETILIFCNLANWDEKNHTYSDH